MSGFQEELCGCFSDWLSCVVSYFVPYGPCLLQSCAVSEASQFNPVLACILDCCLLCIGCAINRGKIRQSYSIEGNFLVDCLIWLFCYSCASCQEYREVKRRKNNR